MEIFTRYAKISNFRRNDERNYELFRCIKQVKLVIH